mgnify:CR=1 FL=1
MKKTLLCLTIALFACIALTGLSFAAAAPTKSLSVSATISSSVPEIDIVIRKNPTDLANPFTSGTDVTGSMALAFGNLVHTYTDPVTGLPKESGVWYSQDVYLVGVWTQGFGTRYEVKSACTGIGTIPITYNYFSVGPFYAPGDNGGLSKPSGATMLGLNSENPGTVNAISTTFKSIYKSELAPGRAVGLQLWYAVPSYKSDGTIPYTGWTGLPLTQAAGTYNGTVTLSIVAI